VGEGGVDVPGGRRSRSPQLRDLRRHGGRAEIACPITFQSWTNRRTFRARAVPSWHGGVFTGFGPAVSKTAMRTMSKTVWSWRLHRHTTLSERDLARWLNPIVSGWMNYYGRFYRSQLYRCSGASTSTWCAG
jgi:Group II intron, maturase-specific domain